MALWENKNGQDAGKYAYTESKNTQKSSKDTENELFPTSLLSGNRLSVKTLCFEWKWEKCNAVQFVLQHSPHYCVSVDRA